LEHTADVYVAAYGRDLAEALENAAMAMFETMTDTRDVEPKIEETVEVEGYDRQALLYNWLEELLVRFETNNILYSRFKILRVEEDGGGLRLKARIQGEEFSPEKHRQKVGVKAVTYHRMEVQESPEGVTLRFILDI
jgi:SHS2 domain-containing protein